MSGGRTLAVDEAEYRVCDAWSSASGLSLCYFVALGGKAARLTDRDDRRAALEPNDDVAEMSEERLVKLLAAGAPLTETERRIDTPDEGRWLAQSIGPVWAEGVAAGLTGVLFSDLAGSARRLRLASGPIAGMSGDELLALWAEAVRDPESQQVATRS